MLFFDPLASGAVGFASSGHFMTLRNSTHPKRKLDHFVLLLGTEGECKIVQNGTEYTLGAGDYLLLFPNREHYGSAPTNGKQSHYWCHFYVESPRISEDASPNAIAEFGHLASTEKYDILFRQLIDAEYGKYSNDALRKRICAAYTSAVLYELANDTEATLKTEGKLIISSVKEWIKLHSSERISVSDVAEAFSYNPDYLTSVFKQCTEKTVCAYINEVRVKKAKKLLITTDMRIKEIASHVGFADERYFMRVFGRLEGVSPTKYRNAYFNLHINSD